LRVQLALEAALGVSARAANRMPITAPIAWRSSGP
jgi:hypothetical protein